MEDKIVALSTRVFWRGAPIKAVKNKHPANLHSAGKPILHLQVFVLQLTQQLRRPGINIRCPHLIPHQGNERICSTRFLGLFDVLVRSSVYHGLICLTGTRFCGCLCFSDMQIVYHESEWLCSTRFFNNQRFSAMQNVYHEPECFCSTRFFNNQHFSAMQNVYHRPNCLSDTQNTAAHAKMTTKTNAKEAVTHS